MGRKYFLGVAIFGLIAALGVAFFIMGHSFLDLLSIQSSQFEKYNGIVPVIAGSSATIATGIYFDRNFLNIHWFPKTLLIPVVIFLSGTVVGTFVNYVLNGLQNSDSASYFTKPLMVLTLYGVPCAMAVGIIFFITSHFLKARSASSF